MPRPLVIWGGTGHAKVIRDALEGLDWEIVAIFDRRNIASPFNDVPLFVGSNGFSTWLDTSPHTGQIAACVAIGGTDGLGRLETGNFLRRHGVTLPTIFHRTAFLASTAECGEGSHVLAHATVCASCKLGRFVIVNTAASVDHDCVLEDGVHIAPGAHLAGEVHVGACAFVGTGAIVLPRIHIGANAIIGAGAVVTKDVAPDTTVVGNPAHVVRIGM